MTPRTLRWATGGVAALSIALLLGGLPLAYLGRHVATAGLWNFPDVFEELTFVAVPVVGFVLASRRPANKIGWIILAAGLLLGLGFFSRGYGWYGLIAARPGPMPVARAAEWLVNWIWIVPAGAFAFVLLLFPAGLLPSRRWRPAAWFVAAVYALDTIGYVARASRVWRDPFAPQSQGWHPGLHSALVVLWPAATVVAGAALVTRFARSSGEERLQLKWFAAAAALVVVTIIPLAEAPQISSRPAAGVPLVGPLKVLFCLALVCLWVAIAVAILKYKLYEIDVVISKALQYGTLAVFISAVYAALVAGVGTLAGGRRSPLLSAIAAVVVAVTFHPVQLRAARLANRIVYGRRASPYQVLSEFARRIGGGYARDVLAQMATVVAAGTGAQRVVVWLRVGSELRPEAASDGSSAEPLPVDGHQLPTLPDTDFAAPVLYQGELLGAISIRMPRDEPLNPAAEQLVIDVASQAGLALSNAGLIEDLRASRQRLVAAQDEERRRLERNLHDGAQQDLVALAIKLRLASTVVEEDTAETRQLLGELQEDAAGALSNLRDLARGIYPPLLADRGLVPALRAQADKSPMPVVVDADGIGRFGQDIEAAVYFCCLEALQNIAKYAAASHVHICLAAHGHSLRFTVSDDGAGYDPSRTPMGSGQRNMADRLAALDGRLEVRSMPSKGTTITAHLPLPAVPAESLAPSGDPRSQLGHALASARRPSIAARCAGLWPWRMFAAHVPVHCRVRAWPASCSPHPQGCKSATSKIVGDEHHPNMPICKPIRHLCRFRARRDLPADELESPAVQQPGGR
jgi:signal transduction histidine kinase